MIHELKTWPEYFEPVFTGKKTFEVRKNDRNFKEGDSLFLREWNPTTEQYTGRGFMCKVGYVFIEVGGVCGLDEDYCILSLINIF